MFSEADGKCLCCSVIDSAFGKCHFVVDRFLGQEYPLEKGMQTHSTILVWQIPWTEEPGRLHPWGHRVRHNWATNTFTFTGSCSVSFPNNIKQSRMMEKLLTSSVQSLSHVRLFATPWIVARQASLSITNSRSSLKLVHRVGDAIQPSHPLLSPFPPAPKPSQHQSIFQWVNSSHEVLLKSLTLYTMLN